MEINKFAGVFCEKVAPHTRFLQCTSYWIDREIPLCAVTTKLVWHYFGRGNRNSVATCNAYPSASLSLFSRLGRSELVTVDEIGFSTTPTRTVPMGLNKEKIRVCKPIRTSTQGGSSMLLLGQKGSTSCSRKGTRSPLLSAPSSFGNSRKLIENSDRGDHQRTFFMINDRRHIPS